MGLSRNKVAVPEGAAGSPPFYGDTVWPVRGQILLVDHWLFDAVDSLLPSGPRTSGCPVRRALESFGRIGHHYSVLRERPRTVG